MLDPVQPFCVKDQVVVITGAAGGIGFGCARRFAAEGAKVVISDVV